MKKLLNLKKNSKNSKKNNKNSNQKSTNLNITTLFVITLTSNNKY